VRSETYTAGMRHDKQLAALRQLSKAALAQIVARIVDATFAVIDFNTANEHQESAQDILDEIEAVLTVNGLAPEADGFLHEESKED